MNSSTIQRIRGCRNFYQRFYNTEWKKGNIYFNNQTFNDIALTLSRIYNVDIQFASEELRPMRFSGTLGSSGIKNALDILTLTSPMYYDVKDTTIILHHKKTVK